MRQRSPKGTKKHICHCGNINRIGQNNCKECHSTYMRKNRKRHSQLSDEQRKRSNCRSYVNVYIKRGNIKKQPCIKCGAFAEMHHEDYDKPLEIIWLCRKHHLELHKDKDLQSEIDNPTNNSPLSTISFN